MADQSRLIPAEANHPQLHCQAFFYSAEFLCGRGSSGGSEVSEVFKEFVDKAPDIIGKAVQSPLGLAALSVLVLGIVVFLLFREAAGKHKLVAFMLITGGFLGLSSLRAFQSRRRTCRSR